MPDPQAMQNWLMTHMPDWQGGKFPAVASGGYEGDGTWVQLKFTDALSPANSPTLCVSLTREGAI